MNKYTIPFVVKFDYTITARNKKEAKRIAKEEVEKRTDMMAGL